MSQKEQPQTGLLVNITRQPYSDYFRLELEDGTSEELSADDTREWFKNHGAEDEYAVDRCLDYVQNFYKATFLIKEPKQATPKSPLQPRV